MSYPLVMLLILYSRNPLEKRMMTPFKDIASGYDCYDHIRHFVCLASHSSIENDVCIEGYLKKCAEEEKESSAMLRTNNAPEERKKIMEKKKAKTQGYKLAKHKGKRN